MIEPIERESVLNDPYTVRLLRATLSLEELQQGVRVLQVMYDLRGKMRCDPSLLLDCCRERPINPEDLTLKDVMHLITSKHIATFYQVTETDIWALAGYATNLTPVRERLDRIDKMH
jgi:hypothetical protein